MTIAVVDRLVRPGMPTLVEFPVLRRCNFLAHRRNFLFWAGAIFLWRVAAIFATARDRPEDRRSVDFEAHEAVRTCYCLSVLYGTFFHSLRPAM